MAGLMLSAIISDTLLLKSPTTTEKDKKALEALKSDEHVTWAKNSANKAVTLVKDTEHM